VRSRSLNPQDLYRRGGSYEYTKGFNYRALAALAAGVVVALVGLLIPSLRWLYDYAWFVGFLVSAVSYTLLMGKAPLEEREPAPASALES
jgi:nucleobase:cation symporter-1, NCS1 family